jgi:hypothetical protein
MEVKTEGHIPSLDPDAYRKPDSSLGHRVHTKLTNTKLYLNVRSHRMANKQVSPSGKQTDCAFPPGSQGQSHLQPRQSPLETRIFPEPHFFKIHFNTFLPPMPKSLE